MHKFDYSFLNRSQLNGNLINVLTSIYSMKSVDELRKGNFPNVYTKLQKLAIVEATVLNSVLPIWTLSWLKSQDSRFVDYWTIVASYTISPSVTFDSSYRSNVYYIKKKIIDPYS